MVWSSPLRLRYVVTRESESFRTMDEGVTGIPLSPHPGSFGFARRFHTHEGIDLYCGDGETVRAVEHGVVVAVLPFTGPKAGSDWWLDTDAILVEGASGVVVYGEIRSFVSVGDELRAGEPLGNVTQVLKTDKGRPMTMLHLELHEMGTRDVYEWSPGGEKPPSLLDPTPHLLAMLENQERLVR